MSEVKNNPANEKEKGSVPKEYVPMGAPLLKLEVPERDGYHRRWIRGDGGRIHRALRAGYVFVSPEDVNVNNFDLGGDASTSGNTDLGTRVSVISGDKVDATGQPGRLYLMECPLDVYKKSRALQLDTNADIAKALKGGQVGADKDSSVDREARYIDKKRTNMPDLFTLKPNRDGD